MWVISRKGYIFGRAAFVFHLGLAVPAFSALLCGRIFGLRFPRDPVLYNPLQVLFRMFCWLAEHPVLPPSIFLLTTDGGLGHENMA